MKISIITTVDHNVGDDFVREGIKYLARKIFKNNDIEFNNIHKHSPITTRYGFEWFRFNRRGIANIVDKVLPQSISKDKIIEADVVIQSGAPVYWCHENTHCHDNEWYRPLLGKRFSKNKKQVLLNIAAGTCQKYHSDGTEFCSSCLKYMEEFYHRSKVTTVRDSLSKVVFEKKGIDVNVIPCSSIFAIDEHNLKNEGEDYIVLNYMHGGAHYTFGQGIDFERWEKEFSDFYFKLKETERVVLVCHNQKEADDALRLDPKAEIFFEKDDYVAYMKVYSKAKLGLMNRVHGAFMLASFGKPSIVIGNDSRALMAAEIGVKSYFVNDVDSSLLNSEYRRLLESRDEFSKNFAKLKEKAFRDYIEALSQIEP